MSPTRRRRGGVRSPDCSEGQPIPCFGAVAWISGVSVLDVLAEPRRTIVRAASPKGRAHNRKIGPNGGRCHRACSRGPATPGGPARAQPTNDDFAFAENLGRTIGMEGTNVGATKQSGEPNHAGNAGGASVWSGWTGAEPNPTRPADFTLREAV